MSMVSHHKTGGKRKGDFMMEIEGNVVATYKYKVGKSNVTCNIMDAAYINASKEEIQRRIDNMKGVAAKILYRAALREAQK